MEFSPSLKAEYTNKILYIATLALAKLSIISLLINITASERHRHLGFGLTGFIALWGVVSVLVTSFQCGSTYPWRTGNLERDCVDFVCLNDARAVCYLTDVQIRLPSGRAWESSTC